MKIVTKSNYCIDLFTEVVIAENLNDYYAKKLVEYWNKYNHNENSDYYLKAVEDDYKCYDGYAELF